MRTWTVDDVMTRTVVTVGRDTPYREVVDRLMGAGVSAVPVVDPFRRVLGVVSEADLLCKIELSDQERRPRLFESRRRRTERSRAEARTAGDLMTSPAVTALAGTTVTAAARRMDTEGVKRLPVVDDLGRLIGVVSRGDLLKVHLRPDADIRADITEDVLHRVLVVEKGAVDVRVVDGVVTLTGTVDRRSSGQIAVRLTGQVAGVVAVVDELGYDFDDSELIGSGMPFGIA
jgi:CBS-domain-containing membrane protein